MSGFPPVLGLLAVAVCISFTKTTAFPFIQKDHDTGVESHKPSQLALLLTSKDHRQEESNSYNKVKRSSLNEGKESHSANIGNYINREFTNQASGFVQARYSMESGDAFRVKTRRDDSESGNPNKESAGEKLFFPRKDISNSQYNKDNPSGHDQEALNNGKETRKLKNGEGTLESNQGTKTDVNARSSVSEEECDEGEQNAQTGDDPATESEGQNEQSKSSPEDEDCVTDEPVTDEGNKNHSNDGTVSTPSTKDDDSYASATSVSATTPTDDTMPSTTKESSESGGSNNSGEGPGSSEECDYGEESSQHGSHENTVATTTSTKKPNNEDASSGSLGLDSGAEDMNFSDDQTFESNGVTW